MECKDCKGTGEYKGLVVVEDCRTCQGMGKVKEDGTQLDEAGLPEWMRDYKDQIGKLDPIADEPGLMAWTKGLSVGVVVWVHPRYIRHAFAFEEFVVSSLEKDTATLVGSTCLITLSGVPRRDITFNLTHKKWELV